MSRWLSASTWRSHQGPSPERSSIRRGAAREARKSSVSPRTSPRRTGSGEMAIRSASIRARSSTSLISSKRMASHRLAALVPAPRTPFGGFWLDALGLPC